VPERKSNHVVAPVQRNINARLANMASRNGGEIALVH
jgi:hypothetical protein